MAQVSIIIPAYNARQWLAETLASVLAQSLEDFETIVIDDGSVDGTFEFISEHFPWVKIERQENQGVSAARNHGTRLATGEFIQYVDADDLLGPGVVKKRLNALNASGADVAYSDWQRLVEVSDGIFESGELVARKIESIDPDPQIAAFTDFWAPPVALLYRRSIVDRIGSWNERLPIIQDARFLLDAALHDARFVHVPGVGGFYREHSSGSLSRRSAVDFVRDCLTNALEVEEWWKARGGITEARRKALVKVYAGVARGSYEADRATFDEAYSAIQRLEPGYVPSTPRHLNLASRVVGYRQAELLAQRYRRAKKRFTPVGRG